MVESQHIGLLLGKSGSTVNNIQRGSGAVLGIAKKPTEEAADGGSTKQAVTVRGNKGQVAKALAMLEEVLQYNADCSEEVEVDARMMPQLIGKGGEEINRIRAETGAAIDGERDLSEAKPRLKLRGTHAAVEKAKRAINEVIEANTFVSESVVLPWHAIDELIGPNATSLIKLEVDYSVQAELPGTSLFSDMAQSSMFISIASAMTLRGKKKNVDAAAAHIDRLAAAHATDELQLSDDDASLLASLLLNEPSYLSDLGRQAGGASVDFEPRSGVVTTRGEASLDAQI